MVRLQLVVLDVGDERGQLVDEPVVDRYGQDGTAWTGGAQHVARLDDPCRFEVVAGQDLNPRPSGYELEGSRLRHALYAVTRALGLAPCGRGGLGRRRGMPRAIIRESQFRA